MSLWIAIGAVTLAAILPILWPLLRPGKFAGTRLEYDLEVFSDQLHEVDFELSADELTAEEAEEAKREIERRILRAGEQKVSKKASAAPSAVTAVLIALLLPALTLILYVYLGRPSQPDQPLAGREIPNSKEQSLSSDRNDHVQGMLARLTERLRDQPKDIEGWKLLGRSLSAVGQYNQAADAFRKAVDLSENDAGLLVTFGDVLTKGAPRLEGYLSASYCSILGLPYG